MKTIFRTLNMGLILASILALGAVAGSAQDGGADDPNCKDGPGETAAFNAIVLAYRGKTVDEKKAALKLGRDFEAKYGKCDAFKEDVKNLKLDDLEVKIKGMEGAAEEGRYVSRFDTALTAKNVDETFAAGKEILTRYPDKYRPVEIALAGIGGEESLTKGNNKYNDDTLRFAKQSLADLEANKTFTVGGKERYGLGAGEFPNKEDAIAWLNLYVGFITGSVQKNKSAALPYLYKTSQITSSDASKNTVVYDLIGSYYFDELNKIVEQIQVKTKDQKDTDTPEVAQQKVNDLKNLVAQSNGTAERAMDAYSRAFTYAKDATIKARMKKNVEDAYKVRFGNTTGLDAWIASAVAKPFVNPTTPITPISDPEPAKTTSGSMAMPTTTTTTTVATPVKATTTTAPAAKPAAKPTATKPRAAVKKTVAKKI